MNSEEFLREALSSDICPIGFEVEYRRFQSYQNLALQALREFHRLCEKFGIRYQLAYGSLIGAIRDQGQIPWDYDIDVMIPYEDKSRLIDAIRKDLSLKFYAWCPEIRDDCDETLMRISPVGFNSDGIHVDVFYMMALPDDQRQQKTMLKNIDKLFHARSVKMTSILRGARGSKRRSLKMIKEKVLYLPWPQKYAEKEYDRRCGMYTLDQTPYCAPATYDAGKCIYETKAFWDTELIELPIGVFRISRNYDKILRQYYGNYLSVPSLSNRIREVMGALRRIDYYSKENR